MATSVKLSRWEPLILEMQGLGWTVARFARERGLSAASLYVAQRRMRERECQGIAVALNKTGSPFVAVRVGGRSVDPRPLRVQLPNGVVMEMLVDGGSGQAVTELVSALGALPCSV